ncbi:unnamed protein product [Macrosiphum euphorbiae]|uniref:Uncharacterized protein n=1 Tax=Macrosiphum euphorbiae TaxID=13131 RepID=A0AAV0WWC3_9HEMI|nr:unnamed protein product [Macrosiphum euphorbiae]
MAVLKNSRTEALEIRWKSTSNIILSVFDDLQENKQEPSESGDFNSFPVHKKAYVVTELLKNSTVEAPEFGWKSPTDITRLPVVDDLGENIQEPPESCDFHSLQLKKRSLSLPNMTVGANCDASEVGLRSVTSVELPVSDDSPYAGSSITTLMTPAEDNGIETPLSDCLRLVITADTVTHDHSSDEGTEPTVTAVT